MQRYSTQKPWRSVPTKSLPIKMPMAFPLPLTIERLHKRSSCLSWKLQSKLHSSTFLGCARSTRLLTSALLSLLALLLEFTLPLSLLPRLLRTSASEASDNLSGGIPRANTFLIVHHRHLTSITHLVEYEQRHLKFVVHTNMRKVEGSALVCTFRS